MMTDDIKKSVEVLKNGGVILFPSDTNWAIGCDATSKSAVQRLLGIVQNNQPDNRVILMENPALLDRYVTEVPEIAWDLIEVATTPLTVIYAGAKNLAENVVAPDGSVGIRFTREAFTYQLLQRFRRPIVAVPANTGNQKTPEVYDQISEEIKKQADYMVEFRRNETIPVQTASIIKLGVGGQIEIIRK